MPRHISRERDKVGATKKSAPKVDNPIVQKAIDAIYEELNILELSTNKEPIASQSTPGEGTEGDLRLFTKTAQDGSLGYFIQGKFGDSWASGRLGIDKIDPQLEVANTVAVSYVADGGEYITKLGVTYENLLSNNDIGTSSTQVAVGNHGHANYDAHIADTTIHFTVADIDINNGTVSNTGSVGSATTAARSDHQHKFDTSVQYDFTAKQTIAVNSGIALDVTGDVKIVGDLTVDIATTGDGNGHANIDGNVVLNEADSGQNYSDTYTTRINGVLSAYNNVNITHQGNDQLTLAYDANNKLGLNVNSAGISTLNATASGTLGDGTIVLNSGSLRPQTTLTTDLGHITKQFRTIHAGELVVNTLVAQSVMATIGGRIMVAPTSKLTENRPTGDGNGINNDTFKVEHANFAEVNDVLFLQTAPGGMAQYEAVKVVSVTSNTEYVCTRNIDSSGPPTGNSWLKGDAVVNLGHNIGDGFIDITSTSGIYSSSGPHIALHARKAENSNWNVPEVMRMGNLKGTYVSSTDKFGMLIGENFDNSFDETTNPFKGIAALPDGLTLHNTNLDMQMGGSRSVYLGKDLRPNAGVNDVVFALGNGLNWDNGSTTNYKLKFEKNTPGTGDYVLTLDNTAISLTSTLIEDSFDLFSGSTPTNNTAGFYLTSNFAGFYQNNEWKIKLGTDNGSNPLFQLGDPSSNGASVLYNQNGLVLKNTELQLLNNSGNDVRIGNALSNVTNYSEVLIGSWQVQTNSDAVGQGILVKHGVNDYSKIYQGGFNRKGYDYPIHVYQGLHWGLLYEDGQSGAEVNAAGTLNNVQGYSSYGQFPHEIKGMKVGYWLTHSNYANYPTAVPAGRKLLITITKIAGCEFGFYGNSLYARPLMPTAYDFNKSQDTGNAGTFSHDHSYQAPSNYLEDAMILHTDSWNLGQSDFYHTGSGSSANSLRNAVANGLNNGKVFMYEIPENTSNLGELKLLSAGCNALNGIEQRNICSVSLMEVSM